MTMGVLTDAKKMAALAGQRSTVYGFLARVYRKELTSSLLEQIRTPEFEGVLSDLGLRLGDEFSQMKDDELIEEYAVEYTGLFLGPGEHISPHESVHHKRDDGDWGTHWGASTVDIKKFVETLGLRYKKKDTSIPDHISVELEIMQKLLKKEKQAWRKNDTEAALYCLKAEKMFIVDHLAKWIPEFCDKIIKVAEMSFYREMAKVTKDYIDFEKQSIDSYISDAQTEMES